MALRPRSLLGVNSHSSSAFRRVGVAAHSCRRLDSEGCLQLRRLNKRLGLGFGSVGSRTRLEAIPIRSPVRVAAVVPVAVAIPVPVAILGAGLPRGLVQALASALSFALGNLVPDALVDAACTSQSYCRPRKQ